MELTVKEYAHLERVSVNTVKNWIRKGAISVRRTPGGGVRISAPVNLVKSGATKANLAP